MAGGCRWGLRAMKTEKLWGKLMGIMASLLLLPREPDALLKWCRPATSSCSQRVSAKIELDSNKIVLACASRPQVKVFVYLQMCLVLSMKQDSMLQLSYARMRFCVVCSCCFVLLHLICVECTDLVIGLPSEPQRVRANHCVKPLLRVYFLHCLCDHTVLSTETQPHHQEEPGH